MTYIFILVNKKYITENMNEDFCDKELIKKLCNDQEINSAVNASNNINDIVHIVDYFTKCKPIGYFTTYLSHLLEEKRNVHDVKYFTLHMLPYYLKKNENAEIFSLIWYILSPNSLPDIFTQVSNISAPSVTFCKCCNECNFADKDECIVECKLFGNVGILFKYYIWVANDRKFITSRFFSKRIIFFPEFSRQWINIMALRMILPLVLQKDSIEGFYFVCKHNKNFAKKIYKVLQKNRNKKYFWKDCFSTYISWYELEN